MAEAFSPLLWKHEKLYVLDQRRLPGQQDWVACQSPEDVACAVRDRWVRGGQAVACTVAYGIALAAQQRTRESDTATAPSVQRAVEHAIERLGELTAGNVFAYWALMQMKDTGRVAAQRGDPFTLVDALVARARHIHQQDIARCQRIGKFGAPLLASGSAVLTVGNAGSMSSGGWGTALGIVREKRAGDPSLRVFACETRPFFDGSRLSAWELGRDGIDVTLIPDAAAATLIRVGEVQAVVLGADRVTARGDVLTELGGYSCALAARAAGIPTWVATPAAAIDFDAQSAAALSLGERPAGVLLTIADREVAARAAIARCPESDVVPAELVTGLVTDVGVVRPPYDVGLRALRVDG